MADLVIESGLPFEVVAEFTQAQFVAVQQAVNRRREMSMLSSGMKWGSGGSKAPASTPDDTAAFEARVKRMKAATGKETLDLWEVF